VSNVISPYRLIADYFIALSNEVQSPITNLKLQKLVYYAQAWNLAILKKELIQEDFQAWVHGPVIPSLYNDYRHFGWKPIIREDLGSGLAPIENELAPDVKRVLSDVVYEYFALDAYELEKLTHNEDPWILTRKGLSKDEPSERIIDKRLIMDYYSKFVVNDQD
jgi:uncharacterized phage-associated protein